MDADDDLAEHLDPELDKGIAPTSETTRSVPGPLSVAQVVFALHAVVAVGLLALSWVTLQDGALSESGLYAAMAGLLLGVGLVVARLAQQWA
jgi:hypothetical protein